MVTRFGMSEELERMAHEARRTNSLGNSGFIDTVRRDYDEEAAREIDCAVRDLLLRAFGAATRILRTYWTQLNEGAKLLLWKETLLREEPPRVPKPSTSTGGQSIASR